MSFFSWGRTPFKRNVGFSYSLQRKYPFRFFTRSIVALLLILFGFFTVFNIATNGYDLQPIFTNDPNSTLAQRDWFQNALFTFGDSRLLPKCQGRDIAVGTQFLTTNLGFSYTLQSIEDSDGNQRSSISYLNHTLENCRILQVNVILEKEDQSRPGTDAWYSWRGSYAKISASCNVTGASGTYTLQFSNFWNLPLKLNEYNSQNDQKTHASVWWGISLLARYWLGVETTMAQGRGPDGPVIVNGELIFTTEDKVKSMNATDVFSASYSFLSSGGSISYPDIDKVSGAQMFNNMSFPWSRPLTEGLSFAKMFYSLILVDVGETDQPNWLLDDSSLQLALQSPDNFNRPPNNPPPGYNLCNTTLTDWWRMCGFTQPGKIQGPTTAILMNEAYPTIRPTTGPLGTRNATIYSQYTCTIPTRKSTSAVVWTTLIANFVLLQAAYTIVMFIATEIVTKRDSTAMYCDGCLAQGQVLTSMPTPYLHNHQHPYSSADNKNNTKSGNDDPSELSAFVAPDTPETPATIAAAYRSHTTIADNDDEHSLHSRRNLMSRFNGRERGRDRDRSRSQSNSSTYTLLNHQREGRFVDPDDGLYLRR